VLPTLAVILWAYGMYALFVYIFQRRGVQARNQSRCRKLRGFTLVCGIIGLGLILWCGYSADKTDQKLKLAGFLGTVYAEGWPEQVDKGEYLPAKAANQGAGEQPAYALLHPGTPTSQIEPEKKLIRPRPTRSVKKRHTASAHEKSGRNAKVTKTVTSSSKKDKMAAKSRAKKKKRSSAASRRQANAG
jgi:hypothetical protein